MFGREACLPVDFAFGISLVRTSAITQRGYVDKLQKNLNTAYEKAQESCDARGQWNRRPYDLRVRVHTLRMGDKMLLRNLRSLGKWPLSWPLEFLAISHLLATCLPVSQVHLVGRTGPLKTWHWIHVLPWVKPLGYLQELRGYYPDHLLPGEFHLLGLNHCYLLKQNKKMTMMTI